MELEELLLRKEELPISLAKEPNMMGFRVPLFTVPIYHKLLTKNIRLDPSLADTVFEEAARQWYKDLKLYLDSEESIPEREWTYNIFHKKGLAITRDREYLCVNGIWRNETQTFKNGFVFVLSINRNAGGSLVIPFGEARPEYFGKPNVIFSKEKFKAYKSVVEFGWDKEDATIGYSYGRTHF